MLRAHIQTLLWLVCIRSYYNNEDARPGISLQAYGSFNSQETAVTSILLNYKPTSRESTINNLNASVLIFVNMTAARSSPPLRCVRVWKVQWLRWQRLCPATNTSFATIPCIVTYCMGSCDMPLPVLFFFSQLFQFRCFMFPLPFCHKTCFLVVGKETIFFFLRP